MTAIFTPKNCWMFPSWCTPWINEQHSGSQRIQHKFIPFQNNLKIIRITFASFKTWIFPKIWKSQMLIKLSCNNLLIKLDKNVNWICLAFFQTSPTLVKTWLDYKNYICCVNSLTSRKLFIQQFFRVKIAFITRDKPCIFAINPNLEGFLWMLEL